MAEETVEQHQEDQRDGDHAEVMRADIEIVTDARGFTATQLTIALTRTLSLLTQAGSFGGSNAQLRYQRDF